MLLEHYGPELYVKYTSEFAPLTGDKVEKNQAALDNRHTLGSEVNLPRAGNQPTIGLQMMKGHSQTSLPPMSGQNKGFEHSAQSQHSYRWVHPNGQHIQNHPSEMPAETTLPRYLENGSPAERSMEEEEELVNIEKYPNSASTLLWLFLQKR